MSESRKILVLGNDCRSFLTTIRSYGRAGFEVHTTWLAADHPALASRHVAQHHDLPHPASARGDAEALALAENAIVALLARENFAFVVPCNDECILPLRAIRDRLPPSTPIYLLDDEAHAICSSKQRTHELALSLGVPVPRSERLDRTSDLQRPLAEYALPVVLKPLSSFDTNRLSDRRAVEKVYERERLMPALERMLTQGPLLLQDNFLGTGVGVEILARRGEILVAFQHERVHEPLHGGGSSYRRSVPCDPRLLDATAKLARAMDYHGVGMFEYKVDPRTGQWVLIEINGRLWGSLPLAIAAGADFPLFLYQMWIEGRTDFPRTFRTDVYCRNLLSDIEWLRANWSADKNDPTLATRPIGEVVGEVVNVLRLREHVDTFTLDDPAPGWVELRRWLGERLGSLPRRAMLLFEQTGVGRRLLRRRLLKACGEARTVAFICHGNICRSPFAARLARLWAARSWVVLEGGTGVRSNGPPRSSPSIAQTVAPRHGVDLRDHRAQRATADLLRRADLVLAFDDLHRREALAILPEVASKLHLLGAALPDGPIMIADPDGGDEAAFEHAYERIAAAVKAIVPAAAEDRPPARPR